MNTPTPPIHSSRSTPSSSSSSSSCSSIQPITPPIPNYTFTNTLISVPYPKLRSTYRRLSQPGACLSSFTAPPKANHKAHLQQPRVSRDVAAQASVTIKDPITIPPPPVSAPRISRPRISVAGYCPQKNESRGLQEIMPGLYVAFEDDNTAFGGCESEELKTLRGQDFTHIVSLSTRGPTGPKIKRTVDKISGARKLELRLPPLAWGELKPSPKLTQSQLLSTQEFLSHAGRNLSAEELQDLLSDNMQGEGVTGLEESQLLAARDFIACSGYDMASSRPDRTVRLLITTPRDRCTDAISALSCYLAFATEYNVSEVVKLLDNRRDFLSVWKGVVSQYGADFVDFVSQL